MANSRHAPVAPSKPLEGIYLSMMDKLGVRVEAFGGTDNALEI